MGAAKHTVKMKGTILMLGFLDMMSANSLRVPSDTRTLASFCLPGETDLTPDSKGTPIGK